MVKMHWSCKHQEQKFGKSYIIALRLPVARRKNFQWDQSERLYCMWLLVFFDIPGDNSMFACTNFLFIVFDLIHIGQNYKIQSGLCFNA